MLDWGIIRRSNSKYISPLMTSEKKNSVRVCIDGRELNKRLIMDHESPRNIEELLQIYQKIQVMTSLDLTSSFRQIPLKEESKQYTAFMHEGKIYKFEVCPFGMTRFCSPRTRKQYNKFRWRRSLHIKEGSATPYAFRAVLTSNWRV